MPHTTKPDIPFGMFLIQKLCPNVVVTSRKYVWTRGFVLLLTFLIYTCYHASRKPFSVVKSVLHQNCSALPPPSGIGPNDSSWCDWKPFDTEDSNSLFGLLDSAFLFSYAFAMFFSGFIAERMNLRYFLSIGLFLSGVACYMFGMAKHFDIHIIWYFVVVQIFGGIFQTTGWPGVVAVMGNWFKEEKNGFIFGVWNSHTSVGNILGTLIAGYYVESDWSFSFIVIAIVMVSLSLFVFLFLVPEPSVTRIPGKAVNSNDTDDQSDTTNSNDTDDKRRVEQRPILTSPNAQCKPIGFVEAVKVPGVIEFSLCLFFAKLVSYTFLYWLPMYIKESTTLGAEFSANLSTLFDVGGIFGGIFAGFISDLSGMQACTCASMLVLSAPLLYLYYLYGGVSITLSICLLLLTGALVNGPYALITTAISAKLGLDPSLSGNSKAISTVTAIIDGTGSIGAAVGPLLTGFVSNYMGWQYVFYMLMGADVFALVTLYRLVKNEMERFSRTHVHGWTN